MRTLPIVSICRAVIRRFLDHDGLQGASSIAFAALFSILPFLVAVIALGTLIPTAGFGVDVGDRLFDVFPADVAHTLQPAVEQLLATPSGGLFALSVAIALWTCSSGLESLRSACNQAFDTKPRGRWWLRRLQAVAIVVVGAGGLLGLVFLLYAGLLAEAWIGGDAGATARPASEWGGFRPVILAFGALAMVALLFRLLPEVRAAWSRILFGSALVVGLWVGGGAVLSRYIAAVSEINPIYATMGGIIGVMVFFYFFAAVMVLGIELVAELEERAGQPPGRTA